MRLTSARESIKTAGIFKPVAAEAKRQPNQLNPLDKLYRALTTALDNLVDAVGLKVAQGERPMRTKMSANENRILVMRTITV